MGSIQKSYKKEDKYSYWSTKVLPRRNNNRRYKESRIDEYFFIDVGKDLAQNFTDSAQNKNSYVYRITPTVGSVKLNTDKLSKQLKKVNPKKASGPGRGTCKELSILQDAVKSGLEIVFDRSIQENKRPNAWKLAKVKTAHKKGERQEVTNYRPLSMLNIPGKLLEGQVCEIIDKHLENNELISDKQWGFWKGRSTEGLLLQLTEEWKSQIDRGYVVGIIFIDFQKAFDTVSHDVLFHKLQ